MKEIKENIPFMIKSILICAALILLFSCCKKKEYGYTNFDGKWVLKSKYGCYYPDTVTIKFKKRKGAKSKNSNVYEVSGTERIFACPIRGGGDYHFLRPFEIISLQEEVGYGTAKDRETEGMNLVVTANNEMTISYDGVFYGSLKINLKRVQ